MKNNYEERITTEIQRMLRYLDEACLEQNISMEDAVEWFKRNKSILEQDREQKVFKTNKNVPYRERAEYFAGLYVKGLQKKICVEVLCFLYEMEKCPNVDEIVIAVTSKVTINAKSRKYLVEKIFMALEDMNREFYHNEYYFADGWIDLKNNIFRLSKTL